MSSRHLRYVELKSGHSDNGPAWIGFVKMSKSGRTIYFNGHGLQKLKGRSSGVGGGNYVDMVSGESLWVSGVKKNSEDRHWAGAGKLLVERAAIPEYLAPIGVKSLDQCRCEVADTIIETRHQCADRVRQPIEFDPDVRGRARFSIGPGAISGFRLAPR